ncbi:HigA family addiction module antitoxin [Parapedobacter sp. DT-150]|uniref:HigA family addiction module antitoxin n=1 Tax=Parapedobacter sp. DT-150 TaxID=3396162 RepID=UPI003F1BD19B
MTLNQWVDSSNLSGVTKASAKAGAFVVKIETRSYRLAKDTGIPQTRVSQIIKGQRRITADTAIRLSRFFGNSVKFWLGIQDDYDIRTTLDEKEEEFENIKQVVFV